MRSSWAKEQSSGYPSNVGWCPVLFLKKISWFLDSIIGIFAANLIDSNLLPVWDKKLTIFGGEGAAKASHGQLALNQRDPTSGEPPRC
jgi:hypothetical protein